LYIYIDISEANKYFLGSQIDFVGRCVLLDRTGKATEYLTKTQEKGSRRPSRNSKKNYTGTISAVSISARKLLYSPA